MTSFVLKLIAIITMFCDHISYTLYDFSVLNYIGRIAFPIFAFQLTQGYIHTSNIKKYTIRLFIFAIISQIPFWLFLKTFLHPEKYTFNIFFTLLLGLICIIIWEYIINKKIKPNQINESKSPLLNPCYIKKAFAFLVVLLIAYIGEIINVDYGLWGILTIFSFYLFRENKLAMFISFITLVIIKYGIWCIQFGFNILFIYLALSTLLSLVFIGSYNGKKGKNLKYAFYAFYPIHLLILYLIF